MDFENFRDDLCIRADGVDIPVNVNEALNGPFAVVCANVFAHFSDKTP